MSSAQFSITGIGRTLVVAIGVVSMMWGTQVLAAIGCTLSNPADDLKYLFPEMTTYKEELKEFHKLPNAEEAYESLRERLGNDLDPIYETQATPYTVYSVFRGKKKIGIVHGVNVPGKGGVIQVFLAVEPEKGTIQKLFFQRLESSAASALRDKEFRAQFEGIDLGDFYKNSAKMRSLKAPKLDNESRPDYAAALRGVKKNLILLDIFVFGSRAERNQK